MEKELTAKDLRVVEDKKVVSEKVIADKAENAKSVPSGYIKVKLSSLGKLGLPEVVHVRDYRFEEALMLAEMTDDNYVEVLIQVMNSVIFEDIDIGKGHRQDLLEIMLSIYGTWYSPTLDSFRYYVNTDLEGEELESQDNISVATLYINSIKTDPIDSSVKLPIVISKKDIQVGFLLPRLENEVISARFVEEKYAQQDQQMAGLKKMIDQGGSYTVEDFKAYHQFVSDKGKDSLRVSQAQLLDSFNGKKLNTLAEKLEALDQIPLSVWRAYNSVVSKKMSFGVRPEVEFVCSINHTPITRSFQFREFLFVPAMDDDDDTGFDLSFG